MKKCKVRRHLRRTRRGLRPVIQYQRRLRKNRKTREQRLYDEYYAKQGKYPKSDESFHSWEANKYVRRKLKNRNAYGSEDEAFNWAYEQQEKRLKKEKEDYQKLKGELSDEEIDDLIKEQKEWEEKQREKEIINGLTRKQWAEKARENFLRDEAKRKKDEERKKFGPGKTPPTRWRRGAAKRL